jgi:hypothetical protein
VARLHHDKWRSVQYTIGLEILFPVAICIERESRTLTETLAMNREVSQGAVALTRRDAEVRQAVIVAS